MAMLAVHGARRLLAAKETPVCAALVSFQRAWLSTGNAPLPYSKQRVKAKKPVFARSWLSLNDPKLGPKFLRYAERTARELGVLEDVRAFDEAAAAFPKPPQILAATVLERGNVILRDVDNWEADFVNLKLQRQREYAKRYPQALLDMWQASEKVLEKGSGEGDEGGKQKKAKPAAGSGGDSATIADGAASAPPAAEEESGGSDAAAPVGLSGFYERAAVSSNKSDEAKGLAVASRISSADQIGDLRSLDRAYTQRLVLLVKDKATGEWVLPGGEAMHGEPMVRAAERWLRTHFADPFLDVWYVGRAPIGHQLQVFAPAKQQALGCYGAKVFYYRAEILAGRFRLPRTGAKAAADPRDPATFPYDDFLWLTRDESEAYLARPSFKYLHQIFGAGAGEEHARTQKWKERAAAKGLTLAQATGRRAHRVERQRLLGLRMPTVATRQQAELAASKWGADKSSQLQGAVDAHYDRAREGRVISAQIRAKLNRPSMLSQVRVQLAAARAKRAAVEAAQ